MKIFSITLLSFLGFLLLSWVFYIALMNLRAVRDRLHPHVKVAGYIVLGLGLMLDLVLAWLIGPLIFLVTTGEVKNSLPRELTFTAQLKRHRRAGGLCAARAAYWCENWLNPFVVGGHC